MLAQRLDAIMFKCNMLAYTLCIELSLVIYRQIGQQSGLHADDVAGSPGHISHTSYSDAGWVMMEAAD